MIAPTKSLPLPMHPTLRTATARSVAGCLGAEFQCRGLPGPSWGLLASLTLGMLAAGCGGKDYKKTSRRGLPEEAMAANLKDVGKPSVDIIAEKAEKKEGDEPKRRRAAKKTGEDLALPKPEEFTERDFVENEQESRDPFRNPLLKELAKAPVDVIQPGDVVYLKDYALSELKVMGIVGGARRFAMVLDPRTGRTTILQKRDRIGKERALIFDVLRDHILVLVPRLRPDKDDPYERKTIYVDEQRKIVDIGSDALRPDESGIRYSTSRRRASSGDGTKEP